FNNYPEIAASRRDLRHHHDTTRWKQINVRWMNIQTRNQLSQKHLISTETEQRPRALGHCLLHREKTSKYITKVTKWDTVHRILDNSDENKILPGQMESPIDDEGPAGRVALFAIKEETDDIKQEVPITEQLVPIVKTITKKSCF
ncbi:hypothetical protein L9F63_024607, partial [Diploptera punctata]